jgi:hypothetical protein
LTFMSLGGVLAASLGASLIFLMANICLLLLPISPTELRAWRVLRVRRLRHWITKRRVVSESLHPTATLRKARRYILWHIVLTSLFSTQLAWALAMEGVWWRPLSLPLVIFSAGYVLGSLVQRQKIAVLRLRRRKAQGRAV